MTSPTARTWTRTDSPDGSVRWDAGDALVTVAPADGGGWACEVFEGRDADGGLSYIGSESAAARVGVMPAARRWVRALTIPAE
jgi:hypothetical protein